MTFRDDHQATLDRNDALERDLETANEKTEQLEEELAKERARNDRLEAALARNEQPQPETPERPHGLQERPHIPIWREDNEERRSDFVGIGIAIAIVFGMALFVLALALV